MATPTPTETHPPTTEAVVGAEAHAEAAFPPFDPSTFASQLFWLAISFGLLYLLMSRVALPRIATILEERNDRIADDFAEAERLKRETDEAIAAYEQALSEARHHAHSIANEARERMKAESEAERQRAEAELDDRLDAAEARIAAVKTAALADVEAIACDTAEALVEALVGGGVSAAEVKRAVDAAAGEGAAS